MLTLKSVTKYYGAQLVLSGISISIGKRTRLGIVGPNGIGKSTLQRVAAGLEAPDEGEVICDRRPKLAICRKRYRRPIVNSKFEIS